MEARDLALIEKLSPNNEELRNLWSEHLELEEQLAVFARKPRLTSDEQMEEKRLKKTKLRGKDRIFDILAQAR